MAEDAREPAGGEAHREPAAESGPGQPERASGHGPADTRAVHAGLAGESEERLGSQSELLGEMKALRRRARTARHAYWFPLVLFGVLTCVSVPFYIQPTFRQVPAGSGIFVRASSATGPWLPFLGGSPGLVQGYLAYYWIVALLDGLLLTQLWYWWHARRIGLVTPARGYLLTTTVLTVLAVVIPPLSQVRSPHWLRFMHRLQVLWPGDLVIRGTFPFFIITVGLLVLAWAERSRALTVTAVVYTGAALLASLYDVSNITYRLGWNLPPSGQFLPNVLLPALVLLVAGAGAFAVQGRHRTAA